MGKRQQRDQVTKRRERDDALTMAFRSFKSWVTGKEQFTVHSKRKPSAGCRSFAPSTLARYEDYYEARGIDGDTVMRTEQFYDEVTGTSPYYGPVLNRGTCTLLHDNKMRRSKQERSTTRSSSGKRLVRGSAVSPEPETASGFRLSNTRRPTVVANTAPETLAKKKKKHKGEESKPMLTDEDEDETDLIPDWIEDLYDNSDRHSLGIGLLSRIFGSGKATEVEGFDEDRSSRPFFTYWITLIQVIIFICVVSIYGIGPISSYPREKSELILTTSLTLEQTTFLEQGNMWIGPSQQDLIHVGAKYSLCMREDTNLQALLEEDKIAEGQKACCYNNDGSGCVMTSENDCNEFISTWLKYGNNYDPIDAGRTNGSVCGQDPAYCSEPNYEWPDDITEWPICENTTAVEDIPSNYHMTCEVLGRPCCVGIRGECVITTREKCDFRKGVFHQDATLCSQVHCVEDICGMFPFLNASSPDQFYRLFSNVFLHAGIMDLLVTVVFQFIFMRDLEKLISSWRMVIIYVGSGVAGSLASATFIPYYVEAGPAGAQFGVIAALVVELLRFERRVKDAKIWKTILKLSLLIIGLFLLGLVFPQIDNYSHLFGLCFGGLIAFGLRPYNIMCNRKLDQDKSGMAIKIIVGITCVIFAIGVFVITVILFYVAPVTNCDGCMYFNCVPFTSTYCDGMSVSLEREVLES